MNLNIRFATDADIDWCISQDFSIKKPEIMRNKISHREIMIAELDGKPVGYLRMEYLWSKIPYMGVIEVSPAHQRQGIGKALLQFLENKVRAEGHESIISSAESIMPEAQEWHRRMGFVRCGFVSGLNPNNVDEIFFRKTLLYLPGGSDLS